MAAYNLFFKKSVQKDLENIPIILFGFSFKKVDTGLAQRNLYFLRFFFQSQLFRRW